MHELERLYHIHCAQGVLLEKAHADAAWIFSNLGTKPLAKGRHFRYTR